MEETRIKLANGKDYAFKAPARGVRRVFIHCSASDNPDHDNLKTIRDWHLQRGFATVGYHFYVRKTGSLELGRDLESTPAAQQGNNVGAIAICLGGEKLFTADQFDTLQDLVWQIHQELPMATFHGHCEVSSKSCPNFDYVKLLRLNSKGELT